MKLRAGTPDDVGVSPGRVERLRMLAQSWVEEGIHPSIGVLLARRGVVILHEAFGRSGPEKDAPALEKDAIFPLVSISKPITAATAMVLVEDGLLGLNRPVREYLPEFEGEGKERVMIRHLMTHTSGIVTDDLIEHARKHGANVGRSYPDFMIWVADNPDDYLRLILEGPVSAPVDREMVYGSANYDLLGQVISRITGSDLGEVAAKRIFAPLGMEDTFFVVPASAKDRIVRRPSTAAFYDLTRRFMDSSPGSIGAYSTVLDMAVFGEMFRSGGSYGDSRVLSRASVRALTTNQIPGLRAHINDEILPEAGWGLGWGVHGNKKAWAWDELLLSETAFMHSGSGGVIMWVDPTYESLAIFFSVYLDLLEDGRPNSSADLFINAALATIEEL